MTRRAGSADDDAVVAVLSVDLPHGLHARPAARFVQAAAGFDAAVSVRNLTTGAGPADATSLNGVATLGVREGQQVEVRASGPDARTGDRRPAGARRPALRRAATTSRGGRARSPSAAARRPAVRSPMACSPGSRPRPATPWGPFAGSTRRRSRCPTCIPNDAPAELADARGRPARDGGGHRGPARRGRHPGRRGRRAHLRRAPAVPARRGTARSGARCDREHRRLRGPRVA